MSFETVVQTKIYEALNGVISCPVYDRAPQEGEFPYATIGESIHVDNDSDGIVGNLVNYTINLWSRKRSRLELKTLQGEVFDALHLTEFSEAGLFVY